MIPLRLERLNPSKDSGRIFRWMVADGATVTRDQPVVEIEMGRATYEVEAPSAGVITIVAKQFATVAVGAVLA